MRLFQEKEKQYSGANYFGYLHVADSIDDIFRSEKHQHKVVWVSNTKWKDILTHSLVKRPFGEEANILHVVRNLVLMWERGIDWVAANILVQIYFLEENKIFENENTDNDQERT